MFVSDQNWHGWYLFLTFDPGKREQIQQSPLVYK